MAASGSAPEPVDLRRRRYGLAALLSTATLAHVARPDWFLAMIPTWLPGGRDRLHALATVAEGVSAVLLWSRRTRRAGGAAAAVTLLGVYLANIEAVRRGGYTGAPGWLGTRGAAIARLPLQVPLVWWAVRVWRGR